MKEMTSTTTSPDVIQLDILDSILDDILARVQLSETMSQYPPLLIELFGVVLELNFANDGRSAVATELSRLRPDHDCIRNR